MNQFKIHTLTTSYVSCFEMDKLCPYFPQLLTRPSPNTVQLKYKLRKMTLAKFGYEPWPPISYTGATTLSFLQAKVLLLLFFMYIDIYWV